MNKRTQEKVVPDKYGASPTAAYRNPECTCEYCRDGYEYKPVDKAEFAMFLRLISKHHTK